MAACISAPSTAFCIASGWGSEMKTRGHNPLNPLLVRRGGRAAAGVVAFDEQCVVSHHPVCAFGAATPPHEEGTTRSSTVRPVFLFFCGVVFLCVLASFVIAQNREVNWPTYAGDAQRS